MNIFLPYQYNVERSVQSLDDVRLQKQAVEAYQLLESAMKERNGEKVKNYHPVYQFYKNNIDFLAYYGLKCCLEWEYRFNKKHSLTDLFRHKIIIWDLKYDPPFTPYYMEGSKDSPFCIRTTKDVDMLFQQKLIHKWQNDNRKPKWTNRDMPEFYKDYLDLPPYAQDDHWDYIRMIKKKNYTKCFKDLHKFDEW